MPDEYLREDAWVIDTSSILEIRRGTWTVAEQRVIYAALAALVEGKRLFYPRKVFEELERNTDEVKRKSGQDRPYNFASKTAGTAAAIPEGALHDPLRRVLAVRGVADLVDVEKSVGAEEADPYVLALALHLTEEGRFTRIITEDRRNKPDKVALASACGLVGIPVVPVKAFLVHLGIAP